MSLHADHTRRIIVEPEGTLSVLSYCTVCSWWMYTKNLPLAGDEWMKHLAELIIARSPMAEALEREQI